MGRQSPSFVAAWVLLAVARVPCEAFAPQSTAESCRISSPLASSHQNDPVSPNANGDAPQPPLNSRQKLELAIRQREQAKQQQEQQPPPPPPPQPEQDSGTTNNPTTTPPRVGKRERLKQAMQKFKLIKNINGDDDDDGSSNADPDSDMSSNPDAEIFPEQNKHGIYQIKTPGEHTAVLKAHADKLVVIKFYAGYCRACAVISPKFIGVTKQPTLKKAPIVYGEMLATQENQGFFKSLEVLSLPTVHLYDTGGLLIDNFSIGPTKFPALPQKLEQFVQTRVDPVTNLIAPPPVIQTTDQPDDAPRRIREVLVSKELVTEAHLRHLRWGMPFLKDCTGDEFDELLGKAKLQTYLPGDVIMRQGMPPETFYVIKSGVCEMLIKSRFDDPISTPPNYLGATISRLTEFDYFGERALSTGEPYAASVRALEKTRVFAFKVEDIPDSSILSRKRRANQELVAQLSSRYELPEGYVTPHGPEKDDTILELLVRFKQIRQVAKCFDYVISNEPLLGNKAQIARRSLLVSKLSKSQRDDFAEVFRLIVRKQDKSFEGNSGTISLLEMRRFMESIGKKHSDRELSKMINKANPLVGEQSEVSIGLNEFLGVMAEAEFYALFTDTFQELDRGITGYVRVGDLAEALSGVRDLVGGDEKTLIDGEDQDVQVDYEQFAKMLIGAAL